MNWSDYQEEAFLVPDFEIKIDGKPIPPEVKADVLSVSYRDDLESLGSFEILLSNEDPETRKYRYSEGPLFDPGHTLELWMGYVGEIGLRLMIRGEITIMRPTFATRSFSRMVVSGLDVLHKFRDTPWSEIYEVLKDSEIAELVGERHGVKVHTDAAAKAGEHRYGYLVQDRQLDLVWLTERARRNGYDLFLEKDRQTLYFGPTDSVRSPRNVLRYGSFSLEFEPTVSTVEQVKSVTVTAWSPTEKDKVEWRADNGWSAFAHAFSRRHEILSDQPVNSGKEAKNLTEGTLRRIQQRRITGTGRVVGIPELWTGTVLVLEDLDRRFTGEYFVTATSHTFDEDGYITRFECRREPE